MSGFISDADMEKLSPTAQTRPAGFLSDDEMAAHEAAHAAPPTAPAARSIFNRTPDEMAADKQATLDAIKKQDEVSQTGRDATLNALTFDHLPQIKAKLGQVFSGEGFANDDKYIKRRDEEIAKEKQLGETYPGAKMVGTAQGYAIPMLASMGMAAAPTLAAEGAEAAQALSKVGMAKQAALQIGKGAATGFGMSAASNPGDVQGVVDPFQAGQRIDNGITGAKWGAGLAAAPYALKAGAAAVNAAAPGAKWLGKKAVSVFLGPSGEAVDAYLANPHAINHAPSVEAIKDGIDDSMQHLFNGVETAKISEQEAKEALQHVESQVRTATQDAGFKFRVKSADIREQLSDAQDQLESAFNAHKQRLADTPSPLAMVPDVHDALGELKKKISQGSGEAYDILDRDPNAYSVRGAGAILRHMADDMNIQPYEQGGLAVAGSVPKGAPITKEMQAAQAELHSIADMFENTPEKVSARELKKMLQQLDQSGVNYNNPGFSDTIEKAKKLVRGTIDQSIKSQNPEYAQKMAEVSQNLGIFNQGIDRFGDLRTAGSRLKSIGSQTAGPDRELLSKLGQATGRDFDSGIKSHMAAQAQLTPEALSAAKAALPQGAAVDAAAAERASLARPEAQPEFVQNEVAQTGLPQQKSIAQQAFENQQAKLQAAKDKLEPFQSLTPRNSQNAVQGLMKNPGKESIDLRRKMQALDQATGNNFTEDINNRRIAEQFEKGNTNGSRNALMFGSAGAAIGALTGPLGAGVGLSVGTTLGGAVDKFGPQIAKKVLDGSLAVKQATDFLMKLPKFSEMSRSNPTAFAQAVRVFAAKSAGGGMPAAASSGELDSDSSRSSSYVPEKTPGNHEDAKQSFLQGN